MGLCGWCGLVLFSTTGSSASTDADIPATQDFIGQIWRFFHHVLISVFSSDTDSLVKARVFQFAQECTNNFK